MRTFGARLFLLAALCACGEPESFKVAQVLKGRLVVAEAGSTRPAANATIAFAGTNVAAKADADGRFAFADLPPEAFTIVARHGSHVLVHAVEHWRRGDLGELTLARTGAIAGTVVFEGTPQAGAVVVVQGWASTRTQADGTFRIEGIPAGSHQVVASGKKGAVLVGDVPVVSGEEHPLELVLGSEAGSLSGTAHVAGANDHAEIAVALVDADGFQLAQVKTGSDGRFAVSDLDPGLYTVVAKMLGWGTVQLTNVAVGAGAVLGPTIVLVAEEPGFCREPSICDAP